jgi:hypothetical protein
VKTTSYTFYYYEQGYQDPSTVTVKARNVWEANEAFKSRYPTCRVAGIRYSSDFRYLSSAKPLQG